jgi:hypothetical protein
VKEKDSSSKFWFGLAIGALGGMLLARRRTMPPKMPNRTSWERLLAEKRGEFDANLLIAQAQARYEELYSQRPRFSHPALRAHVEGNILPALALYQTLLAAGVDQEEALAELDSILTQTFGNPVKVVGLLDKFPAPFETFKTITRKLMDLAFPPQGWQVQYLDDDDQIFGFNIHRCIYLETLTQYGAPELTSLFCKADDLIGDALPPEIVWERTGTLGTGAEYCDFRWRYTPAGNPDK